ncbi:MAG: diaminopropionate ammonia-lyase [Streptosporangiales bacterium]|nr:diaminopropionate ammonia-lyase [Streptosporangiales bacterium]
MREVFHNASASASSVEAAGFPEMPTREPLAFHQRLPGYRPSPLVDAPGLAEILGVAQVSIKDESSRFGLPAFKVLGACWAVYRALQQIVVERLGVQPSDDWTDIAELRAVLAPLRPMTLTAVTAGNHGRAVARVARWLDFDARILVPAGTAPARIAAIEEEGASVVVVDGTYDDAVERLAGEADERTLLISDTAWPGYEQIPRWVIEGYSTIFWEIDDVMEGWPDLVIVPVGVGALAAAAVRHYRRLGGERTPVLVGVESLHAACVLESLRAGGIVTVPGPHDSIMAGLNAGTPSLVAWPYLSQGLDAVVAIEDDRAREGMRALARVGVVAGETGAAALGALIELIKGGEGFPIDPGARVLLLSTEGVTDREAYELIVGEPPVGS